MPKRPAFVWGDRGLQEVPEDSPGAGAGRGSPRGLTLGDFLWLATLSPGGAFARPPRTPRLTRRAGVLAAGCPGRTLPRGGLLRGSVRTAPAPGEAPRRCAQGRALGRAGRRPGSRRTGVTLATPTCPRVARCCRQRGTLARRPPGPPSAARAGPAHAAAAAAGVEPGKGDQGSGAGARGCGRGSGRPRVAVGGAAGRTGPCGGPAGSGRCAFGRSRPTCARGVRPPPFPGAGSEAGLPPGSGPGEGVGAALRTQLGRAAGTTRRGTETQGRLVQTFPRSPFLSRRPPPPDPEAPPAPLRMSPPGPRAHLRSPLRGMKAPRPVLVPLH